MTNEIKSFLRFVGKKNEKLRFFQHLEPQKKNPSIGFGKHFCNYLKPNKENEPKTEQRCRSLNPKPSINNIREKLTKPRRKIRKDHKKFKRRRHQEPSESTISQQGFQIANGYYAITEIQIRKIKSLNLRGVKVGNC